MRALRDMNLPKFVFEDVPLFLGLIADLFPGVDCPRVRYPRFNDAVEETLTKNKYILLPDQVGRCVMCQMCVCMCVYVYVCVCVCVYMYVCICVCVCMCVSKGYVCVSYIILPDQMGRYFYVFVYVCVCIRIYYFHIRWVY